MLNNTRDKINGLLERFVSFSHPWDYIMHFVVSLGLVLSIFLILKRFINKRGALSISILFTFLVGLIKEMWLDKAKEGFSGIDMAANIFGIYLAYFLIKNKKCEN